VKTGVLVALLFTLLWGTCAALVFRAAWRLSRRSTTTRGERLYVFLFEGFRYAILRPSTWKSDDRDLAILRRASLCWVPLAFAMMISWVDVFG
jgi:hypothetical protein